MKKIIYTLVFIFLTSATFAQSIAGDWYGALNIPGRSLHIVFHILKNGENYTSTMDSPDQGANGIATDTTTITGNQVTITISKYKVKYTGTYLPDSNKIAGVFKQGINTLPLTLSTTKPSASVATPVSRPQDPKDFPYKQEEIVFTNPIAGDRLAGTLTMPADGKASRIVILITGSGPQNRNEELLGHRPFLVWSDWLTRHGIAVLRYDDRGTAQSTGVFNTATSADFADDVEAAVNYIQSRADLKNLSIGLMGHSEGGMIAPIVASRDKAVKFIVLLAGPGVPITQLMLKQTEDQMRLGGASEEAIQLSKGLAAKMFTTIAQGSALSTAALKQKLDTLMYRELNNFPKADLGGKSIPEVVQANEAAMLSPWYRYFIAFNPADYLTKVKCPVLALDGTKDMQVNAEANLAGIKASLERGGNKHFEVLALPGLNHLFQKANTGSVAEYSQSEETVDPIALEKVSSWINSL